MSTPMLNSEKLTAARKILAGIAKISISDAMDKLAEKVAFEDDDAATLRAYAEAVLNVRPVTAPSVGVRELSPGPSAQNKSAPQMDFMTPFRFVQLPNLIVAPEEAATKSIHEPIVGGFCASIDFSLTAESPLLIGSADTEATEHHGDARRVTGAKTVEPLMLDGKPVIPGASVRGMLRSVLEIVALGRLGSANLHHHFPLRDFNHPAYGEKPYPVSKLSEVKAGWLTGTVKDNKPIDLAISPLGGEKDGWWHIEIEAWSKMGDRATWAAVSLREKYDTLEMAPRGALKQHYDFKRTYPFGPVHGNGDTKWPRWVRTPMTGGEELVVVCSDKVPKSKSDQDADGKANKRYEYLFKPDGGPKVPIDPAIVELFHLLNSSRSKNKSEPIGSWQELLPTLAAGERIPVFYIGSLDNQLGQDGEANFFFGLTRLMKVPHLRSVKDVLASHDTGASALKHVPDDKAVEWATDPRDLNKDIIARYKPDFVENLFGYVIEPKDVGADKHENVNPGAVARKGRVACGFMTLDAGQLWRPSEPVLVIQSQPRASYAPFYLMPGRKGAIGSEADYSAHNAPRLAGRKRYLPRDITPNPHKRLGRIKEMGQRQKTHATTKSGRFSEDVASKLSFVLPKQEDGPLLSFSGRIKLTNVTAVELGAVLFALTLGEGSANGRFRHMLGRAKAFGAGQMRLSALALSARPISAPATVETDVTALITHFVTFMKQQAGCQAYPDLQCLRELLGACDPACGSALDQSLDYMPLKKFKPLREKMQPLKKPRAPWAPATGADGRAVPAPVYDGPLRFWK